MTEQRRISFSAVVVCYNEAHLLPQCLESLNFCQEMIVVDLGSTDGSLQIAQEAGAKVLHHERVPIRNRPLHFGMAQAQNDWIVSIDPDEVFPKEDVETIERVILENEDIAGVRVPWQFYFRGKELNCTVWGRADATKCSVVNRDRIEKSEFVHKEFMSDQDIYRLSKSNVKPIKHYWMSSYGQLFEKTWRYIKFEGKRQAVSEGRHFSWYLMLRHTASALKKNLFDHRGLYGGFTGIFLSFFHTWYVFMRWLSLRHYENQQKSANQRAPSVSQQ